MSKIRDARNIIVGTILGASLTVGSVFAGADIKAVFNNELKYIVNGEKVSSSSSAVVINNATYLQLRDVANMLDYKVAYSSKDKTITLTDSEVESTTTTSTTAPTTTSATTTNQSKDETPESTTKIGKAVFSNASGAVYEYALSTMNWDTYTEDKGSEQSKAELAVPFTKLPTTVKKGGYSVTVESITEDEKFTYFNVRVVNDNATPEWTGLSQSSSGWANVGMDGQAPMGVPIHNEALTERSKDKEFTRTVAYRKGAVAKKNPQNIRLGIGLSTMANSYAGNKFIFNIDTRDIKFSQTAE